MGQGLQKWEISSAQLVRLPSPGPVSGFLMSRAPEARKPIAFKLCLLDRARQETTFWKLKMVNWSLPFERECLPPLHVFKLCDRHCLQLSVLLAKV